MPHQRSTVLSLLTLWDTKSVIHRFDFLMAVAGAPLLSSCQTSPLPGRFLSNVASWQVPSSWVSEWNQLACEYKKSMEQKSSVREATCDWHKCQPESVSTAILLHKGQHVQSWRSRWCGATLCVICVVQYGRTALHFAARRGDDNSVSQLLEEGAAVDALDIVSLPHGLHLFRCPKWKLHFGTGRLCVTAVLSVA